MRRIYFGLILVLVLAAVLRFYQLGGNPPSLTWDETSWGYNAYALGHDGRDEFGRFLPVDYLESFGDYKPVMYAYLDVLPVRIFGLNAFATRFPSAFFGVLTVLVTFFLTRRIFRGSRLEVRGWGFELADMVGLVAAFLLAISPWHIMLSRAAFEANVAAFFVISGVWLFLEGVTNNISFLLPFSIISFVLSVYTFNSARVVAPLLCIALCIAFYKQLWQKRKYFLIAVLCGLVLIAPTVRFLFSPQASLRFEEVNIFSDPSVVAKLNQEVKNDNNASWSKIIHNRRLAYGVLFLKHYFDNLNPSFLFIKGDGNPKFSTQDIGEMYLIDLPFFVLGILFLFRKRQGFWWIVPIWLVLAIIPAATARETPHALRIENALPTFQILVAYGVMCIWIWSQRHSGRVRTILWCGVGLVLLFEIVYFQHGYYVHYPLEFSGEWQYGYADSIAYAQSEAGNYSKIFVTDKLGRPYVYYLFYTKTDPSYFRSTAEIRRDAFGFVHVDSFGNYIFYSAMPNLKGNILYINVPSDVPAGAHILKSFYLLNNQPALEAYTL